VQSPVEIRFIEFSKIIIDKEIGPGIVYHGFYLEKNNIATDIFSVNLKQVVSETLNENDSAYSEYLKINS
jgi:hypothetical protein